MDEFDFSSIKTKSDWQREGKRLQSVALSHVHDTFDGRFTAVVEEADALVEFGKEKGFY